MDSISDALSRLLRQAEVLAGDLKSVYRQGAVQSAESRLGEALSQESDPARREKLASILEELKAALGRGVSGSSEPLLLIETSPLEALMTLIPQGRGKSADPGRILKELGRRGIPPPLSSQAIDAASKTAARGELVYSLKIAEGTPPVEGEDASIEFAVRAFDKRLFLDPKMPSQEAFLVDAETVAAGSRVATLKPSKAGRPGRDVYGRPIPAAPVQEILFRLGPGLRAEESGSGILALVSGCLVVSDDALEIVPFRIFEGGLQLEEPLEVPGNVVVKGHLTGTASLSARDVYVEGNVEGVTIRATGDVAVAGTLQDKSRVSSDGTTLAGEIRDADVDALGDVLVRRSIVEGRITSGGWVRVGPKPGTIEGGSVSGRKGIIAQVVGSDWGIETSLSAGRDAVPPARLSEVEKAIERGKAELRQMGPLLPPSVTQGSDLAEAAPELWENSGGRFERAGRILRDLAALSRTQSKLEQARGEISKAPIEIRGRLLPPVQIGIGPATHVFREPLGPTILVLGHNKKIRQKDEEPPKKEKETRPTRKRNTRVRHSG
jgi:hypothetical protein